MMHNSIAAGFYRLTSPNSMFHFSYTAKLYGDTLRRILLSESWKSWNLMLRTLLGSRHRTCSGFSSANNKYYFNEGKHINSYNNDELWPHCYVIFLISISISNPSFIYGYKLYCTVLFTLFLC
jgi:hypothetical protein